MKINKQIKNELQAIYKRDKQLKPQAIVNAARSKTSALHACFTWDDSKAGEKWRLEEARRLIVQVNITTEPRVDRHVDVTIAPEPAGVKRRAYQSPVDTRQGGGGYVAATDLRPADIRALALAEVSAWESRMRSLMRELGEPASTCDPLFTRLREAIRNAGKQAA